MGRSTFALAVIGAALAGGPARAQDGPPPLKVVNRQLVNPKGERVWLMPPVCVEIR